MVDAAHHGQEGESGGGLGGAGAGGCWEKELNIINLFCGIKFDNFFFTDCNCTFSYESSGNFDNISHRVRPLKSSNIGPD